MAATDTTPQQMDVPTREVAKRVFAAELNTATYTFKTSQDERAPVYVALPTGERANRICITGTVTDIEDVGESAEYLRASVVDPTGTFWVYAGEYQTDALQQLKKVQPPEFVTIVGKPRTYNTDDGAVNVSIIPEDVGVIDLQTRNAWVFETAAQTLERVHAARETSPKVAALAREQYGHDGSSFAHVAAFALQDLLDANGLNSVNGTSLDEETFEKRPRKVESESSAEFTGDDGDDSEELVRESLPPEELGKQLGDSSGVDTDLD
ncbi:DNA-binding protein [Halorubrum sp. CGM5_25_10-8B]|uniref:DNA-binding protein n=1 Tax=Halorubrum sp. CGM5_25_10-8B TaxID=2518115 RepID=UPI0018EE4CE8|nr:DNA-binding protein [Halorubrum sp. CGM5_25_10-8B]